MRKRTPMVQSLLVLFCTLMLAAPALGSDTGHGSHGAGHGSGHAGHDSGKEIHHAKVGDYTFEYRLIDMKEKMKGMKNMPEIKETHHLMLHVRDMHGKPVEKAKVGYLIQGPGDSVEKKMAMAMNQGFGADVTFHHGKQYRVKAKVVAGGQKLMDAFDFTLNH